MDAKQKEIKDALEMAYEKLSFAACEADLIDYEDAVKIAKVRTQVLRLLDTELKNCI